MASVVCGRRARSTVALALAGLLAGCAPDVEEARSESVVVAESDSGQAQGPAGGGSAAQQAWASYLASLDGLPPATRIGARFSAPIEATSVTPSTSQRGGAVFVFDLTAMQPLTGDPTHSGDGDYDLALEDDGKVLRIVPHLPRGGAPASEPWRLGHTYQVLLFGAGDPEGLLGREGAAPVVASPRSSWLLGARPLLTACPDGDPHALDAACLCPSSGSDEAPAYDAACHPAPGLSLDEARQLETERRRLRARLAVLLPLSGPSKRAGQVVLAWQFSIAHGPFADFEPALGRLPFPSDLLLDGTSGKVVLPDDARSPLASLRAGLQGLDGFSTTADLRAPIDVADDTGGDAPLGVAAGRTAVLLNLSELTRQPAIEARPERTGGGRDYDGLVLLHPARPLRPDRDQYAAVLTTDITDGKGRPLRPSPRMQLLKGEAPLVDAMGRSSLPGVLDDAEAKQLEALRQEWLAAGLWEQLAAPPLRITKDRVALAWTFRTQSITAPLLALSSLPSARSLTTDVTIADVQVAAAQLGADVGQLVFGRMTTRLALGDDGTLDFSGGFAAGPAGGRDVEVPFLLIVPRGPAVGVALVQHGLGGWRGDVRAIAQSLAAAGWATIGIDSHLHGARARCAADADCDRGTCDRASGACTTRLVVRCSIDGDCLPGGLCRAGACTSGLAPSSALCMTHGEGGQPVTECRPASSGAAFFDLTRPFATRDNLRQAVIDLAQLQRVVAAEGAGALKAQLAALPSPIQLDGSRTALVGSSLGALQATLALAAAPGPPVGVLSSPGGRLVDLLLSSEALRGKVSAAAAAAKVAADTPEYYQLLDAWRWIVDPADPINAGRYLAAEPLGMNAPRRVIVQEGGRDTVFAGALAEALAVEIGVPFLAARPAQASGTGALISTFFPSAGHGFLLGGEPATPFAQAQAAAFVASGGRQLSPPGP